MKRLASSVLLAAQLFAGVRSEAQAEAGCAKERGTLPVLTAVEGRVCTPGGLPARGAIVTTSAGGTAFAGDDGEFRIALELPLAAHELGLSAEFASGGGAPFTAHARVEVTPGATNASGVLWLMSGGCQPSWLPTFGGVNDVGGGFDCAIVFDDESGAGPRLYAGGTITRAGGKAAGNVARWDGASWSAVGTGTDGPVIALEVFDDGSGPALYAGGDFTSADGAPANHVARWDGTSWSPVGTGTDGIVQSLAVFDDGSGPALYAGGLFTSAGGSAANRIARWDGASWSPLGSGMDKSVVALTVADDGSGSGPALYAAGNFTLAGGSAASHVARWNGTSWSALGSGVDGRTLALLAFDDGNGPALYAAGEFTHAGGAAAGHVAKWDGEAWSPLASGTDAVVRTLRAFDEGNGSGPALFVGGGFLHAGGVIARSLARWNGASWSRVGDQDPNSEILVVFDDGAGGGPALYTDDHSRWDGASWTTIPTPRVVDAGVLAVTSFDDGLGGGPALYAAGRFAGDGVSSLNHVARWDGAHWLALAGGVDGFVSALVGLDEPSGPALYVGGSFSHANGLAASDIARWDGSSWSPVGGGIGGSVLALTAHDDGTGGGPALFAGGMFTTAGGHLARAVAKWDGADWAPLSAGVLGSVLAMASFDDGSGPALFVGGSFGSASGIPASDVARWDGSAWSSLGSGIGGPGHVVYSLVVFDDGNGPALYAGGLFTFAGGSPANCIARWDGSSWSPLGAGINSTVDAMTVFDDGRGPALYACGRFTSAGGVAANRIARWDGASWSPLGGGLGLPPVTSEGAIGYALSVFDDGQSAPALIAGGTFLGALDSGDSRIARWQGCVDVEAPVLSLPDSVVALDSWTGPPGEIVTFTVTASDDLDPSPTVVCTPPSGSFFAPGTTLVHCTATDASGHQSSGDFPVIVQAKTRTRGR